ncbi:cell wall protein [Microbacterium sp. SS28]|uniref:cell wall protein n=1 Tax=Microbacterium sp. SS28 TaxID=2919948 RepID=UPI001FA9DBC4|nr:cell wall protein [Microbacterium sp. SS28]
MTRAPRIALAATILPLVAVLMAAALLLSAPAARAETIYPPAGSCTSTPATIAPGAAVSLQCAAETFSADEDVTITVTGENGAGVAIGMVRLAISTASGHATSGPDGSLPAVRIAFPADARGTYNIEAISASSAGGTAAVTVTNPDGSLPVTGLDSSTLTGLWIGGGLLLLAGAALGVVAFLRRRRDAE